jgi:hypothetical protein
MIEIGDVIPFSSVFICIHLGLNFLFVMALGVAVAIAFEFFAPRKNHAETG